MESNTFPSSFLQNTLMPLSKSEDWAACRCDTQGMEQPVHQEPTHQKRSLRAMSASVCQLNAIFQPQLHIPGQPQSSYSQLSSDFYPRCLDWLACLILLVLASIPAQVRYQMSEELWKIRKQCLYNKSGPDCSEMGKIIYPQFCPYDQASE